MAWSTTTTKNLPKHDHDLGPMNTEKSLTCARCILNAETTGRAIHTCEHGGAFGRRDMTCRRCRQLSEGVNTETALGENLKRKARMEEIERRAIREHNCQTGRCAPVCTAFQW